MGTIREALGFNLRILRGNRSQEAMAEFLGVPKRTYVRFELGKAFPQDATLRQIVSRLRVDEDALVQVPRPTLLKAADQPDRRDPEASAQSTRPSTLLGDIVFMLTALNDDELRRIRATVSVALEARGLTLAELEKIRRHGK